MSGLQFNEGNMPRRVAASSAKKGLTQMLVDKGIVGSYEQAEKVLIGVAVVAFILTGVVMMSGKKKVNNDIPAEYYEEEMMEEGVMMDGEY